MALLLNTQSYETLSYAPNQLTLMSLWSEKLEAAGVRIGADAQSFASLRELIFFKNPFLSTASTGRVFTLDLRRMPDCKAARGDQGVDWWCVIDAMNAGRGTVGRAAQGLNWMDQRPESRALLARWRDVATSKSSKSRTEKMSQSNFYGLGVMSEKWKDEKPALAWATMAVGSYAYLYVSENTDPVDVRLSLGGGDPSASSRLELVPATYHFEAGSK